MAVKLETSLTDLMTSLAVIFILLMLAMVNNMGNASKTDIQRIEEELNMRLGVHKLECLNNQDKGDPLSCTITLPSDMLKFAFQQYQIDEAGEMFLKQVFPIIMEVLISPEIKINVEGVYIEGYTDHIGDDNYNLYLSQNRAFAVGSHLISEVFNDNGTKQERDSLLEWLYLNGRGEQNLIYKGSSVDEELSRRVEVTIRVKSFQQKI